MPNFAGKAALAIGKVVQRKFVQQFVDQVPLLSVLKNKLEGDVGGLQMELPILYLGPQGMNLSTIGVADANEIPSAWPIYPQTQGMDRAKYNWTHWQHIVTITGSENKLLSGPTLQVEKLLKTKVAQMQMAFTAIMDENLSSSLADSRTTLMGIPYMVSASNVVGGISQASNSWWQSDVSAMATASLTTISALADRLADKASVNPETGEKSRPDLLIMAAPPGAFDIYAQVRQLIQPSERVNNNAGNTYKYGIDNYVYANIVCIRGNRLPAGTSYMLSRDNIHFQGYKGLMKSETQRIPGSTSYETPYEWWGGMGTDSCRSHGGFTGTTA
jgi:hypothetical protein